MVEDGVVGAHGGHGGCAEGVKCLLLFFLVLKRDEGVLCGVGELGYGDEGRLVRVQSSIALALRFCSVGGREDRAVDQMERARRVEQTLQANLFCPQTVVSAGSYRLDNSDGQKR